MLKSNHRTEWSLVKATWPHKSGFHSKYNWKPMHWCSWRANINEDNLSANNIFWSSNNSWYGVGKVFNGIWNVSQSYSVVSSDNVWEQMVAVQELGGMLYQTKIQFSLWNRCPYYVAEVLKGAPISSLFFLEKSTIWKGLWTFWKLPPKSFLISSSIFRRFPNRTSTVDDGMKDKHFKIYGIKLRRSRILCWHKGTNWNNATHIIKIKVRDLSITGSNFNNFLLTGRPTNY